MKGNPLTAPIPSLADRLTMTREGMRASMAAEGRPSGPGAALHAAILRLLEMLLALLADFAAGRLAVPQLAATEPATLRGANADGATAGGAAGGRCGNRGAASAASSADAGGAPIRREEGGGGPHSAARDLPRFATKRRAGGARGRRAPWRCILVCLPAAAGFRSGRMPRAHGVFSKIGLAAGGENCVVNVTTLKQKRPRQGALRPPSWPQPLNAPLTVVRMKWAHNKSTQSPEPRCPREAGLFFARRIGSGLPDTAGRNLTIATTPAAPSASRSTARC